MWPWSSPLPQVKLQAELFLALRRVSSAGVESSSLHVSLVHPHNALNIGRQSS